MIKKFVALITLVCFIVTAVYGEAGAWMKRNAPSCIPVCLVSDNFILPSQYGRIGDVVRYPHSKQVVINIQDFHCHAETQRNISRILGMLDKRYGLKKVYVEGAWENLDTSWLGEIGDAKLRRKMVEALIDSGELTGSEYYSILSGRPRLLQGIEDKKLYRANIVRLGKILEMREYFSVVMDKLRGDMERIEKRRLGARNRRFCSLIKKHKAGKIGQVAWYGMLLDYSETINKNQEKYTVIQPFSAADYPEMRKYSAFVEEKKPDYKKIERELGVFTRELKAALPYAKYCELAKRTDNFSNQAQYISELSRRYAGRLRGRYACLNNFFEYMEKSREISVLQLLREERELVAQLRIALSQDAGEVEVSFLSNFLLCVEDYLSARISEEDYVFFREKFEIFKSLWRQYAGNNDIERIAGLELLDEYYRVNFQRTASFIKNTGLRENSFDEGAVHCAPSSVEEVVKGADDIIVVVSGGFHTADIARECARRRVVNFNAKMYKSFS